MPTAPAAPELFDTPVATLALLVALVSLCVALVALAWQVAKHFLDGGRVKVYLNTAVLEPGYMVATMRSGKFILSDERAASNVPKGRALEVAQLVVENPGRIPVTIYSPGLVVSGDGKKGHTFTPRMFDPDGDFGADQAVTKSVIRLESYGRVTFLLDYWSVMPGVLEEAPRKKVALRGFVSVAGRTKRPQKSSWRRRWIIGKSDYTAIPGSPKFTPFAVIWRELYLQLPERDDTPRNPNAGKPITRGMASYVVDEAMSHFDERPDWEDLKDALDEAARELGDKIPMIGFGVLAAYRALDRMEGHLSSWRDGLTHRPTVAPPSPPNDGTDEAAAEEN
jgi:hypothetical protein